MSRFSHVMRADCPLPPGTAVVGYCRDSGNEDQDRSVGQQREAIREYCQQHGLVLEHVYIDAAKQGSDAESRDEFNRMIADLRERFNLIHKRARRDRVAAERRFGVVLWKTNRLSRDALETTFLTTDLQMRGLMVISLVNSLETGDAALDGVLTSIQRLQDQRALDEISRDAKRGLAELVSLRDTDMTFRIHNPDWPTRDGRYLGIMPGPPPTGFIGERVKIGVNRRGEMREVQRLVPDPAKWEAARMAWELRSAGAQLKTIHDTTRLFKTTNGYTTFFRNRIYTGDLDYGGKRYIDFVPALITREMFEAEQQRIRDRSAIGETKHHPRRAASRHLLSGLVVCNHVQGASHPMNGDTISARGDRPAWDFYMCSTRKNTRGAGCSLPRINARALNHTVVNFLMDNVLTFDNLKAISNKLAHALLDGASNARVELAALERKLSDTRRAVDNLTDTIERTGGSDALAARLRKRESELQSLTVEIVALQKRIADADVLKLPTEDQLRDWLESTRRGLLGQDVETARLIIRALVNRVEIKAKQKAVVWYTPPFVQPDTRLHLVTPTGDHPYPISSGDLAIITPDFTPQRTVAQIAARREARAMRAAGATYREIGAAYGVTAATAWNWLNDDDELSA
jgi:DNA invertase Pin-like site-specific DNA recombinase